MSQPSYIIGIDLGTTNSTLAYKALNGDHKNNPHIEQGSIAQIFQPNTQKSAFSLPSFIYYPLPEELNSRAAALDQCHQNKNNFIMLS